MSEFDTLETPSPPGSRELPGGTVTFLFTDIEGSTRLLKRLGERYGDVMADHRRILRGAFEEWGGQEIDTQGDAFFVAFRRAKDAVLAATSAQRALASHAWPDGADVRVRMGLHTGEPSVAEHGYLGLAVHRGARIVSAAHGGQVLVSQTTRALLEDDEPPDVGFRDLGEYPLKDLDSPVRLFQLVIPELRDDFPPPRTEKPAAQDPFGGREEELAEAAEAVVGVPDRRKRLLIWSAVTLLVVSAAAAAFFLLRPGESGLAVMHANSVGAIDPKTNEIVSEIEVGREPAYVEFARGSLWVANSADRTIMRVDPETSNVLATIPVPGAIAGLASGGAGVWVATEDGLVARVNADVNALEEPIRVRTADTGGLPGGIGIAVGQADVWVTSSATTLTRIDPSVGRPVAEFVPDNGVSEALDVSGDSVWVGGEYTVSEVSVELGRVVGTVRIPSRLPEQLAAGAGTLWLLVAPHKLVKVDVNSLSTAAEVALGGDPSAVALGAGSVWVANSADGTVSRIDPAVARVIETVEVGNSATDVAVGGGRVWVTVR